MREALTTQLGFEVLLLAELLHHFAVTLTPDSHRALQPVYDDMFARAHCRNMTTAPNSPHFLSLRSNQLRTAARVFSTCLVGSKLMYWKTTVPFGEITGNAAGVFADLHHGVKGLHDRPPCRKQRETCLADLEGELAQGVDVVSETPMNSPRGPEFFRRIREIVRFGRTVFE